MYRRMGTTPGAVEVEFALDDPRYPFIGATVGSEGLVELAEMIPREKGAYAEFFNISGIEPSRVLEHTAAYETLEAFLVSEYEDGGFFEFVVTGDCPAVTLAELGALPREVVANAGEGRIIAEIPDRFDPAGVIERFGERVPAARLLAKRERTAMRPLLTDSVLGEVLRTELTARQLEVLRTAFDGGYYDWPRQCCGTDIAEELGITSATFSEHIHAAERNLLAALFRPSTE